MASMFFSSDLANPDTNTKFYADLQMYSIGRASPDPEFFMNQFVSWEVAQKENKWQGRNLSRWHSAEYDQAYRAAKTELDPVRRAAVLIAMNDLVCREHAIIPVVYRPSIYGVGRQIVAPLSGWDNALSSIADWYAEA